MQLSKNGLQMLKNFEGFRSKPYLCPAGIPTIGYGSTHYDNGIPVSLGDNSITESNAATLLLRSLIKYEVAVVSETQFVGINQNQFDALVLFAYNLGIGSLKGSTLIKKIRSNPSDPTIRDEFMKWVHIAGGKTLPGLVARRKAEADLYFKEETNDRT